jgi:hypothetical protein
VQLAHLLEQRLELLLVERHHCIRTRVELSGGPSEAPRDSHVSLAHARSSFSVGSDRSGAERRACCAYGEGSLRRPPKGRWPGRSSCVPSLSPWGCDWVAGPAHRAPGRRESRKRPAPCTRSETVTRSRESALSPFGRWEDRQKPRVAAASGLLHFQEW